MCRSSRRAPDLPGSRTAGVASAASGERGVATVTALGWAVVLLTLGWIAVVGAAVAAAQHHLDGAADLAALAAAQAAQTGQDGCAAAAHVASSNGVIVRACERDDVDVVVTVADHLDLPWSLDRAITATARAGP
jgi:secretion/DNA translocation related TadE-like protein